MKFKQARLFQLLQRTALRRSFDEFLNFVVRDFPIGTVKEWTPILEGYEAANFYLHTTNGEYVLKIHEKGRDLRNIEALVKIHLEAPKVGVPLPEIIEGKQGYLGILNEEGVKVPYFLTRVFEGENFDDKEPSLDDMRTVTNYVSRLNTLNLQMVEAYDSWGNKNLVKEYEMNNKRISDEEKNQILPIVDYLKQIDRSKFSKAVIHGDMQRKHVLKNKSGKMCILDFGCMSYDAKVIEVSTFLAWFCFDLKNWNSHNEIYDKVLREYTGMHKLSREELNAIPIFIRASYAAYFLKTTLLMKAGDQSEETKSWNRDSERLLLLSKELF